MRTSETISAIFESDRLGGPTFRWTEIEKTPMLTGTLPRQETTRYRKREFCFS
jgi:hypothetical protein